ncbi:MAG: ribonuclease HI [Anaerolineae bacterium]|nr:ribonuclease HI [Anaerolineae bacterium]
MNPIIIHTDGSCVTQTRLGGWAAVLQCGEHQRVIQGSTVDTTVNAIELNAVVEALKALKQSGSAVQLFTDSNYVVRGVNEWLSDWLQRGWKNARGEQVANLNLWQQLKTLLEQHTVTLTWIPRAQNTQADELAQMARLAQASDMAQKPADDAGSDAAPTVPPQAVGEHIRMEFQVMIAGSRYATREALEYARRVVRRAHLLGHTIVVGDHPKGVDMAVVQECRRLKAKVLVVGVTNRPRNGGCQHGSYVKVERDTYRAAGGYLFDRYHTRDRWMVDNSARGMFIWNGDSKGTKAGYDYMVSRQKEAHLVTFALKGSHHG